MATLSVLKFNDPGGADRVLIALQGLQERQMITLEDAAVIRWPEGNKKPKTHQLHDGAGAGASWGAFWGFLFGLIFLVPLLGMAVGGGMGALTGSLADVGDLGPVRPDRRGDRSRQDHRRAQAVRLRDHLDQPATGGGAEAARGLRPRRVVRRATSPQSGYM